MGACAYHNEGVEDFAAPASPAPLAWKQRLQSPRALAAVLAGAIAGGAITGGYWRFSVKPKLEAAQKLYNATMDMWALYDLQMESKKSAGTYANGLDALLAKAKDGRALKTRLAGHVDLNTITIVGDAEKFKVELNILDADRTLIKIHGPLDRSIWGGTAAAPLPEASSSNDAGAPVNR